MSQVEFSSRRKLPLALSVRISFILMLAAVLPLLVTVGATEWTTRPTLINQANQTMKTDADTRIQLINTYLKERVLDTETISLVPSVASFLALPPPPTTPIEVYKTAVQGAGYALNAGKFRDSHYITWRFFDAKGIPSISAPSDPNDPNTAPYHYGPYLVPQEELLAMTSAKTVQPTLSPVYYNTTTKRAFIDIYAPIYQALTPALVPAGPLLGFMRASLNLDYIWDILQSDQGINSGSAFLLDQNGVRIGDANRNSKDLFTAVTPLSKDILSEAEGENWYNSNGQGPDVHKNNTLSDVATGWKNTQSTFPLTLAGTNYQAARSTATIVPWTYVVISPSSAVTQVADQQLTTTLLVAIVVAALAAIAGWLVAGRIGRPIMRAVDQLRESSEALNILAKKQQSASSEQLWVVDSVQVGLQSVQYYTDATRIAAHKLGELGLDLERSWHHQNIEIVRQGLQQVVSAASYIEKATNYQGDSGQKLSTAIKVTTQVNEQLADGAISATEAASQLEQVVNDLRNVVGK
ncbi:MAG: cache domain-containing protein [Ktedonobacteraceae bacterium]